MTGALSSDPSATARWAAAAIALHTGIARHDVAVVLGSGWAPAVESLGTQNADVPVTDVPGFLPPAAAGQVGRVRSLDVSGKNVLVFLGRTHLYEGRGVGAVVHAVRVAAAAGCSTIILTNAAGGIRPEYRVGDAVLISDHINLSGQTPLVGASFVNLVDLYSPRLRALVHEIDPTLAEGVYAMFHGPQYETPAEVRMARILGADLVGMSTVLEAIAARAEGLEVLGVSLVTNPAAGLGEPPHHEEVLAAGAAAATRMGELLGKVIPRL